MNFMDIKTLDIANGPGCRISLFVSGCRRHCKGCFNPESWDFDHGTPYTKETEDRIIKLLEPDYISGLTILGGEPFEDENMLDVCKLAMRARMAYPDKSVWVYTGFRLEDLWADSNVAKQILANVDVLVDGEFREDLKDIKLQYCGSTNQRVIDVPGTLVIGKITVYDQYDITKERRFKGEFKQ